MSPEGVARVPTYRTALKVTAEATPAAKRVNTQHRKPCRCTYYSATMGNIGKVQRLWSVVKGKAGEPYIQGRAAQVAGTALVADGLIGLENPLDGKKSRVGIVGALVFIVVGVVMLAFLPGLAESTDPYEGGSTTQGVVTRVLPSQNSNSDSSGTSCSVEVTYEVEGMTYVVRSVYGSSGFCSAAGSTYDVSYLPSSPAGGRIISSESKIASVALRFLPWLFILVGGLTFIIRALSIAFGAYLFLWGRKRVAESVPVDTSEVERELTEAWGKVQRSSTTGFRIGGLLDQASRTSETGAPQGQDPQMQTPPPPAPSPPPRQEGPPPGWYNDNGGPGQRWWDGLRWTDHTRG